MRDFRSNPSELLGDVADRREHVLITRNGKPVAVLAPVDQYEAVAALGGDQRPLPARACA